MATGQRITTRRDKILGLDMLREPKYWHCKYTNVSSRKNSLIAQVVILTWHEDQIWFALLPEDLHRIYSAASCSTILDHTVES